MNNKLKFAIIGSLTRNTKDLLDVAIKNGHEALVFKLSEITFETIEGKMKAMHGEYDICDFDIVIFRGYNDHIYEAKLLAEMLVTKNKIIIERTLAENYVRGKMKQAMRLFERDINHPETFQASKLEGWKKIFERMTFPIIAKPVMGRKGRGIKKLDNEKEAISFFTKNSDNYLVQQYFPIKSDYRVFVVGGKVVGVFQRLINEGEYKSNIAGTKGEKIVITREMEKISIDAADAMGYEIAGVDLFEHDEKLYIIEVNVAPQWEKFKLVTGINPAEHIIEYAIKKYLQKMTK